MEKVEKILQKRGRKPKTEELKEAQTNIHIRNVSRATKAGIEALAKRNERTFAQEVRYALESHLRRNGKNDKPKEKPKDKSMALFV